MLIAGSLPRQPSQLRAEQVEGRRGRSLSAGRGDGVAEPALPAAARGPGLSPARPWHLAAGKWEPSGAARAGSVLGMGGTRVTRRGARCMPTEATVEMPLPIPL